MTNGDVRSLEREIHRLPTGKGLYPSLTKGIVARISYVHVLPKDMDSFWNLWKWKAYPWSPATLDWVAQHKVVSEGSSLCGLQGSALKKSTHDTRMMEKGEKRKKVHQKISRLWSRDEGYAVCFIFDTVFI